MTTAPTTVSTKVMRDGFWLFCSPHRNDKVIYPDAMTRAGIIIAAVAFLCGAEAATSPPATFESPCSCHDNHGEHRWAVKNDPSTPPTDASAIQVVTPSDVFSWPGPGEHLTQSSKRTGIENN